MCAGESVCDGDWSIEGISVVVKFVLHKDQRKRSSVLEHYWIVLPVDERDFDAVLLFCCSIT